MKTTKVTGLIVTLALSICALVAADISVPSSVVYKGTAMDNEGIPIQGSHDLRFRFLDKQGQIELFAENHLQIDITEGRFEVNLGTGTPAEGGTLTSLHQVFLQHPKVLMETSIDGQVQNPRVQILPAGHSQATAAALSGPVGVDDNGLHWKGYESKSSLTGIQAVVLGPADENGAGSVPVDSRQLTNPIEGDALWLGESNPLRDLPPIDATVLPEVPATEINRPRHEDLYDDQGRRFGTTAPEIQDPVATTAAPVADSPLPDLNFAGIPNVNGVLPPDTEATVGPNHYIQVVNLSFEIFDKTGVSLGGPWNTNTLWSGFGGPCQNTNNGDAIFLYDEQADRYVLSQFAVSGAQAVCFAISTTPDPTGSYYLYQYNTLRFPDYFKLGVWPVAASNAYFMTTNSGFAAGYDVYAFDRAGMLAGVTAAPYQAFQGFRNLMMPADLDGDTAPPAGSPGIMYTFRDGGSTYFGNPPPPTDSLDIWEFFVDWVTPANSSFSNLQSFIPPDLAEFNWTVCGFFTQNCLPQPGTGQGIDSASWWPMQRFVYRNLGTHEALVGAWTVDVTGTPDRAGVRWFELRRDSLAGAPEGVNWSLYQQGTHSPDTTHRFMPSIAMDQDGNIAIGYSVTSGSVFPSIRYAVRSAGDPLGTLRSETELIAGGGSQTHSAARWGDYSSMELDPADDCTFWFTTEYLEATGSAPWKTRVGTLRIPGCDDLLMHTGFESGTTGAWSLTVD